MSEPQVQPNFRQPPRRSREHLDFIRRLPCCNCPARPIVEPHHPKGHRARQGVGKRSCDFMTVPLCPDCHRIGRHALHRHPGGERGFWRGRDPLELAAVLERITGDVAAGTIVVTAWWRANT